MDRLEITSTMKSFIAIVFALAAMSFVTSQPAGPCTEHGELLADTDNCTIFYECTWGHPIKFDCQVGLEYNTEEKYCDYPKPGRCHAARATVREVPTCPTNPGDDVIHLPNPDDCHSFYKCNDKGEPVLIVCPPGLLFNPDELVCDYPDHAHCVESKHH